MTVVSSAVLAEACAASLSAIAQRAPRVHCITNIVAMNYTANMLLAVGAVPSMSLAADEITDFVGRADALLINLGTLDETRRLAIPKAIQAAQDKHKPWVLDPVFINASPNRLRYARKLISQRPTVIRGNADEISVLADDAEFPALSLARGLSVVVVQTGEPDLITDGAQTITLANGHPWMARITAMGCALSALLGAFLAVEKDPLLAAAQALLALGVAGEAAAEQAAGPGSLQTALLDQLYGLDSDVLQRKAKLL